MTWRGPRKIPVAAQAVDYQDLNEGFSEFVELDGHLAEGNFSDDMAGQLDQVSDLDVDIAYRVYRGEAESNASGLVASASGYVEIPPGPGWTAVDAANTSTTLEVTTGPVLVCASFQAGRKHPNAGTSLDSYPATAFMHMKFGIRVDGGIVPYAVIGDQDATAMGEFMERGVWTNLQGLDIFAVIPMGPGRHTIELVAKAEAEVDGMDVADIDDAILVYSRELFVAEVK